MKQILMVSVVLFVIACCLPASEFTGKPYGPVLWGGNVLAVGWSGIFAGVAGWYANPFGLFGLVLGFMGKPKLAGAAGLVAIAIGCTTSSVIGKTLPGDEGNLVTLALCFFVTSRQARLRSSRAYASRASSWVRYSSVTSPLR